MNGGIRADEYASLRTELLAFQQRAHDVWRWGLIGVLSLLASEIVAVTAVYGQQYVPGQQSDLARLLASYGALAATLLCAFAGAMAGILWQLRCDIVGEMHRIGAYLAVFNDNPDSGVADEARRVGWHVWNRVDNFQNNDLRLCDQPTTKHRRFYGSFLVYACVLAVFHFLTIGLLSRLATFELFWPAVIALAIFCALWWWMWFAEKRAGQSVAMWNKRWSTLAKSDQDTRRAQIASAGL